MNVGMPGTGVGGIFFVLCAILAVPIEIVRTLAGRSSPRRRREALYHALVAIGMVSVLAASYALLRTLIALGSSRSGGRSAAAAVPPLLPVAPVLLAIAVLVAILLAGAAAHLVAGRRDSRSARAAETPLERLLRAFEQVEALELPRHRDPSS
jgi:hypothetical protein